jgi:hypothetical protein
MARSAGGGGCSARGIVNYALRIRRAIRLLILLVCVAWLGLLAYVWIWTRRDWGWGWALVGTINITEAAVLILVVVWLASALMRRFGNRTAKSS